MAATMTGTGELTYVTFGIEKVESTPDGDLYVYGKATDGSVDHDMQIVDPAFSSKAIADWLATGGNVRVQHNPQRDPAGIGVEASTDASGATWVKALIVEPIAQKLVSKGVLRAYSVGISNPTIDRDVTGKARGGIIKAGKIVEISLVDRPANASCGFQLVKSAGADDHAEFVGKVFGSDEVIAKAMGSDVVKDTVPGDVSDFGMSIDFTPNDLWRLTQEKMARKHAEQQELEALYAAEAAVYKRNVSTAERRSLASEGNALSDGSYPIANTGDLHNAAHLARTGHGNAEGAKRLIRRWAEDHGVANPLVVNDDAEKGLDAGTIPGDALSTDAQPPAGGTAKTDTPDLVKDPGAVGGEGGGSDPTPGKKIPKPSELDADGDMDGDGIADKAAVPPKKKKGKKDKPMPPWLNKPADADDGKSVVAASEEKCDTDPKTASGAEEPADMNPAPVGMLQESPAKPHMKGDGLTELAYMRYKTIGIDTDLGILHDLTCPAFNPADVSKVFPYADFTTIVDEDLWQRKALAAATGGSMQDAMDAQAMWQAALTLKQANQGDLGDYRVEAHKAFRDANPGPMSFPTPCAMSPKKFHRPFISDGHAATSQGYGSPNSGPSVAAGPVIGGNFDRPPLSSGHQSPSPSFMKGDFEYPKEPGVPTQIRYAQLEKDKVRRALSAFHDHLNHMFPSTCPMLDQDPYRVETEQSVALPVGIGKTADTEVPAEVLGDVYKYIRKLEKKVRNGEITEDEARTRLSKKTAQRYAEDLKKQVDKGITSIDEVRKALGLPEGESPFASGGIVKNVLPVTPEATPAIVEKGLTPDIMKTMMSEILEPLQQRIAAQETIITEYQSKIDETVVKHQEELDVYRQRFEALAESSDPGSAPMRGLAFNPMPARTNAPAGVVKQAEVSKSVQGMMMRQLERTWRTSENPAEREAAYNALLKYQGKTD